jgi:hypothetical protein
LYQQKLDQEKKMKDSLEEFESKNAKLEKENTALHLLIKTANAHGRETLVGKNNNFFEITQKDSIEEEKMQRLENDPHYVEFVPKIQEARGEFAQQRLHTYSSIFSEVHIQKIMSQNSDVQFSPEIFDIFGAKSIETIDA